MLLVPLTLCGLGTVSLWLGPGNAKVGPIDPLVSLAIGGILFAGAIKAWTVFRVDNLGLHQRKPGRRRFAAWSALSHVGHKDIDFEQAHGVLAWDRPGTSQMASVDPSAFSFLVQDTAGRVAFRIPPWVAHRKELVREIQRRIRAAHA